MTSRRGLICPFACGPEAAWASSEMAYPGAAQPDRYRQSFPRHPSSDAAGAGHGHPTTALPDLADVKGQETASARSKSPRPAATPLHDVDKGPFLRALAAPANSLLRARPSFHRRRSFFRRGSTRLHLREQRLNHREHVSNDDRITRCIWVVVVRLQQLRMPSHALLEVGVEQVSMLGR